MFRAVTLITFVFVQVEGRDQEINKKLSKKMKYPLYFIRRLLSVNRIHPRLYFTKNAQTRDFS